jgi:hypothetical protein
MLRRYSRTASRSLKSRRYSRTATRNLNLRRFFFLHNGGWSPNWVHSARRPLTGLLYLPRMIVRTENLVE